MKKLVLIFLGIFTFNAIHADMTWTLSDDGTLTISVANPGEGMGNYTSYEDDPFRTYAPWYSLREKIKKVIIENGVYAIGDCAFYECSNLTSIAIPNSVTSIGGDAFYECSNLTSIAIPNSVTSIGWEAFYCCFGLTSITIPNSVTSIGGRAFMGCIGLTSVTLPNSITSLESQVFAYCTGLTSITIPNSVTSIGAAAFEACSSLKSVTIPNSVTSIESGAFYYCQSLTSVTIPNSVTNIGSRAFYGCYSLEFIYVESDNTYYDSRNNCNAIIEKETETLILGCKNTVIPNSVTNIGVEAFGECFGLSTITIPNSVKSIGNFAFYFCSNITSITCEAVTPPNCGNYCFDYVNKSIPVFVPANSVEAYKKANGWKYFTNIQAITNIYTLTDGTPYSNKTQLNGGDISYTRNFTNATWQALYIPFSLNYEDWKDDFDVACINGVRQLDKDDNGTIDETIMDVIKIKSGSTTPNMPYLIKAKSTGEKTFSVNNATLYAAEEKSIDCSTTIAKYTFTGTYSSIPSSTMIANGYYAMGGGDLIQSDGSNDLKPYRWYMKVESRNPSYNVSNSAKTITINVVDDEEKETTGVKELRITNYESPVYDINGRMVSDKNLKPGLYIKNGKKFVVK